MIQLIRQNYWEHVNTVIGSMTPDPDRNTEHQKTNFKKFFGFIKHLKKDQQGVAPLKDQGKLHSDNTTKANILNRQFQSVFTPKSPLSLKQLSKMSIPDNNTPTPMPEITISTPGILKMLSNLKPNKAPGPDGIYPCILKELRNEIAPILQILFTKSLTSSQLPSEWLSANVAPIYKKGDKSSAINYRPISLTCICCKLMEHIVASNITKHLETQNTLFPLQHGFRANRSCETQLLMFTDELARSLQESHQIDTILLDFSKAFDKVSHEKLIYKLHSYGIHGSALFWIKSFLNNRTQKVILEGEESESAGVTSGVPQGSVLGPILFLAYINDLPEGVRSKVRLFADDTVVYLAITDPSQSSTLQADLGRLEEWERTWDMSFNPSKCVVLRITGPRTRVMETSYTLHGTTLDVVPPRKIFRSLPP
jgi:hypothetical protein